MPYTGKHPTDRQRWPYTKTLRTIPPVSEILISQANFFRRLNLKSREISTPHMVDNKHFIKTLVRIHNDNRE